MIVQITLARNERVLIEELLPVWSTYADGFVFLLDKNTDDTKEYLESVKEKYNILEVLETNESDSKLSIESDKRQMLFDAGKKYSNNIICLDADEYLDGELTKPEVESLLVNNPDTMFMMQWVQYTSANTVRVDGPWRYNLKDRLASYSHNNKFAPSQTHGQHLPSPSKEVVLPKEKLFIAHLQWLDKMYVAIKQYYWKVEDYINSTVHGVHVVGNSAYDASVNNFQWEEEYTDVSLKIAEDIFENVSVFDNYRIHSIHEKTKLHNIPNLGDWELGLLDMIPMYFCTAADDKHYPLLLNLIGSIHKYNFYNTVEIRVYDLGLTDIQKNELRNFKRVVLCTVDATNPDILTPIETGVGRSVRGLFSWKPVIIKDSLEHREYILYLDAGTTVLSPLNQLFKHIAQNGSLLFDCGHSIKWMTTAHVINKLDLATPENSWILEDSTVGIDAGFMGLSRSQYDSFVLPMYELSKDIANFTDDGTCPSGWGTGRHDQTLFSILARKLNLPVHIHDRPDIPCHLTVDGSQVKFHITHNHKTVTAETSIYRSRWDLSYPRFKDYTANIRRNLLVSVVTAIGDVKTYGKFLSSYFNNIIQQYMFERIEFIIVYSEWSEVFDLYTGYKNIRFIKEDAKLGVYNAWNIGIRNASAEFITNWNVDDLRMNVNNCIKYKLLSTTTDIDLVYNYYVAADASELDNLDIDNKSHIPYPDEFHTVATSMCMAGPDPMWRKSIHSVCGMFNYTDFDVIGDWEMWIRMAKHGMKFKLLPHVLCIYVDHESTVSRNHNKLEEQKQKLQHLYP